MTQQIERLSECVTIEDRRDALTARDADLNRDRKSMALEAWRLYLAWKLLYSNATTREYIAWLGHGEVHNRWYAALNAGLALDRGLDRPELRLGELAEMGKRLLAGETPEEVQAQPAPRSEKANVKISRDTVERFDEVFAGLPELGPLTREQKVETVVEAWTAAPESIRRALVHAAETGENPLDALVRAVDERRDYRRWLKAQPCMVCGVAGMTELHHVRTDPNGRYRTQDVYAPVCTRHHIARPGDNEDAAHTGQTAWMERHFGSVEQFWLRLALLYVRYAAESEVV